MCSTWPKKQQGAGDPSEQMGSTGKGYTFCQAIHSADRGEDRTLHGHPDSFCLRPEEAAIAQSPRGRHSGPRATEDQYIDIQAESGIIAPDRSLSPALGKRQIHQIKYITQLPTRYPQFVFFANLPQYVKDPYKRFLERQLRERFDLSGSPVQIYIRKKKRLRSSYSLWPMIL